MTKSKKIVHPSADFPANWEIADAAAFQALANGKASPDQQKRALNWLLYGATGTYDSDYRPDPREHAFVSGKRNVGLQIIKLLHVSTNNLINATIK
jgi:hypothetical protein